MSDPCQTAYSGELLKKKWTSPIAGQRLARLRAAVAAADLDRRVPARMLDLGCADGILWPYLHGRVGAIVGVNYDDWLTRQCHQRFPDGTVMRADARSLPFNDASFDLITCLEMFHYLPLADREAGLRELWRVLRPGGRLVLSDPIEVGLPGLLKFFGRIVLAVKSQSTRNFAHMLWRRVFYKVVDMREQDRIQNFHFDIYRLRRQVDAVFGGSTFSRLPYFYPFVTTGLIVADRS